MRIKIVGVLFLLVIMAGFAVAQNTTSSTTSATPGPNTTGSNSFSTSTPNSGTQIPLNSGNSNAPIQSTTPSTSLFNSENLNSTPMFDSTSGLGTPSMDQILSTQSDLISSTSSFLNETSINARTSRSVLGETIFGDTLVPGMTNIPIVNVVPSTGTTPSSNPNSVNPQ